jgi:hypothetical protein
MLRWIGTYVQLGMQHTATIYDSTDMQEGSSNGGGMPWKGVLGRRGCKAARDQQQGLEA